jgi:hypothetical protein
MLSVPFISQKCRFQKSYIKRANKNFIPRLKGRMQVDILRPLADGCGATGAPYIHPFQTDAIQIHISLLRKRFTLRQCRRLPRVLCVFGPHTPKVHQNKPHDARAPGLCEISLVSLGGKCGNVVATGIESMHVFAPRVRVLN